MTALSIVSYFTEPLPVVDASKYQSWIPDFDKPQKAATLPVQARTKRMNTKHEAVRELVEKGLPVKEIAKALDMTRDAVSSVKYMLKHKQPQAVPVAVPVVVPVVVPVDVDSEQPAAPEVAAPAPTPVCLPASPEPQRTHVLDWKARFDAIEYSVPPAGCLPKKRPKKVKVMTAGQVRTSTYNVVHAGTNNKGMAVNSTPSRAINCAQALGAAPPARTPSPFD